MGIHVTVGPEYTQQSDKLYANKSLCCRIDKKKEAAQQLLYYLTLAAPIAAAATDVACQQIKASIKVCLYALFNSFFLFI